MFRNNTYRLPRSLSSSSSFLRWNEILNIWLHQHLQHQHQHHTQLTIYEPTRTLIPPPPIPTWNNSLIQDHHWRSSRRGRGPDAFQGWQGDTGGLDCDRYRSRPRIDLGTRQIPVHRTTGAPTIKRSEAKPKQIKTKANSIVAFGQKQSP